MGGLIAPEKVAEAGEAGEELVGQGRETDDPEQRHSEQLAGEKNNAAEHKEGSGRATFTDRFV